MNERSGLKTNNMLLDAMEPRFRAKLDSDLVEIELPHAFEIQQPNSPIEYCYFPTKGISSIIAASEDGKRAEVGLVGWEGVVPVAPLLDAATSPFRTVMQVKGRGLRIEVNRLTAALDVHPELRRLFNRYIQAVLVQCAGTAFTNANHTIEQRLARWILMCHDRTSGDNIALTHEFLSVMLAVRRPSVTTSLHVLEGHRLVKSERSLIVVRDRAGLEAFAASAYGQPESEYRRLFGSAPI